MTGAWMTKFSGLIDRVGGILRAGMWSVPSIPVVLTEKIRSHYSWFRNNTLMLQLRCLAHDALLTGE
jgi:hypothetical protein